MKRFIILPLIIFSISLFSQNSKELVTVKGQVVDINEDPLFSASIYQKETDSGVFSDIDGYFEIKIPMGAELVFSVIGHETQTIIINKSEDLGKIVLAESICDCGPSPAAIRKKRRKKRVIIGLLGTTAATVGVLLVRRNIVNP